MKYLALLMLALSTYSVFGQATQQVLTVDEYEKTISEQNEIQLVDVRTPDEYAAGHLEGAVNINWFEKDMLDTAYGKFDKSKTIYLYCQSGNRSNKTYQYLKDKGFTSFVDLKGGYGAWRTAGKKVVK